MALHKIIAHSIENQEKKPSYNHILTTFSSLIQQITSTFNNGSYSRTTNGKQAPVSSEIGVNGKHRLQATVKYISTDSSLFFCCSGSESRYMSLYLFLFPLSFGKKPVCHFFYIEVQIKNAHILPLANSDLSKFLDSKVENLSFFTMQH